MKFEFTTMQQPYITILIYMLIRARQRYTSYIRIQFGINSDVYPIESEKKI